MKILISTASKHGSTAEIGRAIAGALTPRGHDVSRIDPEDVDQVQSYDAVILGSAVYAGHWMKSAIQLGERFSDQLRQRPVWLFSSGPIGDPPKPTEDPVTVSDIMSATGAREHRVFTGKLDKAKLGFAERAVVTALHAPYGDFRRWDEIEAWAVQIADALSKATVAS